MPTDEKYSDDNPFVEQQYSDDNPFANGIEQEPETMPLSAMAGESFVNSFLAAPDALADLFAQTSAGMGGPAAAAMAPDVPLPRPTVGEIGAGVRSIPEGIVPGGESFTEAFGREMSEQDAIRMNTERAHPVGSTLAPLAGDALALTTGRMPFTSKISKFEDLIMTVNKPDILFSTAQVAKAPITVRKAVGDAITNSKAVRSVLRGAGRSIEAGIEATVLDVINGNDPGETFGYAAGLQLANSGLLSGGKAIFSGPASAKATKLASTLVVGAALWQQLQIATPIDDNFLSALNVSGEKIFAGLLLGAAAGIVGGGRLRGSTNEMSKTAQTVLDAFTAVPRGTVIGLIRQANDANPEEQQAINAVMNAMLTNPGSFTQGELSRINSSIKNKTLADTATVLMRDNRFVKRISSEPEPGFDPAALSGLMFEKPTR
jgi:hypothetical protein